ncbi:MAG: Rpn family recombination-promoting nuclease/putative transposase [Acidaminococcus sp.]|uniref:Rpn family recombination-promoting nuclease/putative transposase n=1 Tax=Acidaminococcus sp. TaxID=1872103 RepID=UPI003F162E04
MENLKSFDELTFLDNFMFQCVLRNQRLCKHLIEKILGISVKELHYQEFEKTINLGLASKGIRLDVYVKDDQGRVYDIEMQCSQVPYNGLAKRTRFYQSMIDMEQLEKGEKYENLNASYIIFICTFDPFGRNLPMYTFTHCCEEENTIKLNDGETRLFLNSKGSENAQDPEIAAFLRYVDGKAAEGEFVRSLDQEVQFVKSLEKVRREYMILSDEIRRRQEEAAAEAMAKGIQQERESNILGMLQEKIPMETISRITKASIAQIREIGKLHGVL